MILSNYTVQSQVLLIEYRQKEVPALANIMIVDDEKEIADLLEIYLTGENFTVFKFYTPDEVLASLVHRSIINWTF